MIKALKPLVLGLIIFVLLMNVAYSGTNLAFSDVDVKVGSRTSKNLDDGDLIDDEAEPGDTVEFRVEVRNNFTDAEDLEIEDITVEVTIEGIDDGDDMDDESSEFDLRQGREKRINLRFQVPEEVEEDTFDVLITAQGEDENGNDHDIEMKLRLEVEKESHLLKITRASLSPAEVTCNRRNVQAAVTVINIGNEDEEDVTFHLLSPDLNIDLTEELEELTAEPNEDESRFSNTYSFSVPQDAEASSYPVIFRMLYDNDRKKAEETVTLTVNECLTAKKQTEDEEDTEETEDEVDLIISGKTTGGTTVAVIQPETPEGTIVTQESFLKSNAFVVGIIIAEVVAVMFGIVLIVSLFRKRG